LGGMGVCGPGVLGGDGSELAGMGGRSFGISP
jgi:hypothetical protein